MYWYSWWLSVKDQRLPSFNSVAPVNRLVIYKELEFTEYDKQYQEHLIDLIEQIDSVYRDVIRESQKEEENA